MTRPDMDGSETVGASTFTTSIRPLSVELGTPGCGGGAARPCVLAGNTPPGDAGKFERVGRSDRATLWIATWRPRGHIRARRARSLTRHATAGSARTRGVRPADRHRGACQRLRKLFARPTTCLHEGAHGLPLIGSGDGNDGLNRVGVEGRGESVWLAWFLVTTLRDFARTSCIAEARYWPRSSEPGRRLRGRNRSERVGQRVVPPCLLR